MPETRDRGRTPTASIPTQQMSVELSWPRLRAVTIHVSGEVDLCTAPDLADILHREVRGPVDDVVVDLSGVTFLGVAGLNCLLRAGRAADERETGLRIAPGVSYAVSRVFALLRSTLPEVLTRVL
jgi:anti-anti-sigma factor